MQNAQAIPFSKEAKASEPLLLAERSTERTESFVVDKIVLE